MTIPAYSRKSRPPRSASTILSVCLLALLMLNGCASTIIGTATDAAIEVAKVPFKVGAAVIDVVAGDDDDDAEDEDD